MNDKRSEKGQFVEGGPPGPGRPRRVPKYVARCRSANGEVIDTWLAIMRDKKAKHADRIKCGELLMAYGYGRPRQALELSGEGGGPIRVQSGEVYATLAEIEAKLKEPKG